MTLVPDEAIDVPVAAREAGHTGLAPQSARAVRQQYVDYFRGRGAIPMPDPKCWHVITWVQFLKNSPVSWEVYQTLGSEELGSHHWHWIR